jgi:hypothetical protein
MLIKQLSVFVENRPAPAGDHHRPARRQRGYPGSPIADTTDFGILRLMSTIRKGLQALQKAKMTVSITNVIGVRLPDVPGGLNTALEAVSAAGISVEY